MIRMQYPNINGNPLCDGRIHQITPHSLSRIEDLDLFLLSYYDETCNCDCYTVLYRTPNGEIRKIPLLDYNYLFKIINNNWVKLTPENMRSFFDRISSSDYIRSEKPIENFQRALTQTRAAIILYVDETGNIYLKKGNSFSLVSAIMLSEIMQRYDIEWHRKETDTMAPQNIVNGAIGRMFRQLDDISCKERYRIGDIHHYSVGYRYTDTNGHRKGNSSV